jgi:hypothetical protein
MARTALHSAHKDATPALLTVAAAHSLLPSLEVFDEAGLSAIAHHWPALIDGAPMTVSLDSL